ncbi:patatin-like phospholipase family protein [Paracoccus sp. MC1862]|uniref:patatin-like phospholipase family protein n=2 Tax=Paracoccus TaxID=265 RepID=UPI001602596E|nr:patatin-like phospholipase family protein [Paracoccus sp. MC1862]MBB1496892.1 patatin-like phospholipase family protein [Paracoccus sp. MC1862]
MIPKAFVRMFAVAAAVALAGCGIVPLRMAPAVPAAVQSQAEPAGYAHIRFYGDELGPSDASADDLGRATLERLASGEPLDLLALSGGADAGAFGAGVLKGWTQRGDRPEFDYVTGVSTGALIAPLAFLGPGYDDALQRFYTQTTAADIFILRPLAVLAGAPSIGDSAPLRDQINRIVTPQMVAVIAAERRRGRLLLIGTTDLDAQRQVIWDIGRIAASGQPDRVQLIRKILLASASVPGAFPPVTIDVVAGGRRYQELHVDGGVTRGVFAYPPDLRPPPPRGPRRMWVIRNSKLAAEHQATPPGVVSIAARSVTTLIKHQSVSNIADMQAQARRDGFDFNVTAVPPDLNLPSYQPFDAVYMNTLFAAGLATGRSARGWADDAQPLLGRR